MELHTQFDNREDITGHLSAALEGLYSTEATPNRRVGGRRAALAALAAFRPDGYGRRNFLDGNVSRLSAYLRHGMLSIREVADHVRRVARGAERDGFLKQLAWREFFYRVLDAEGEAVLADLEPPKYAARFSEALPDDVREARTGLPCADAWVSHLVRDGYMHNHERLWFAAYLVHFRRVHWRAGFGFFREHLLCGDIASNALSWQWVASTFSQKPYFMNKENISKYSGDRWCATCTARCPFDRTYPQLERDLFGASFGGR